MIKHIKLHRNSLCPCRSGWMIGSCCIDPSDGKLRKKIKSIQPPQPATGYSHPNCYLANTNDCSEDISREHYFSANILEQLAGQTVEVSGMPWLKAGETKRLSIDNLTSKILCKRHNENLSPLDQEAGAFFRELRTAFSTLNRKSTSKKPNMYLLSGTAIELWMLKLACGAYFSKVAAQNGERLAKTHSIDMEKVRRAFFEQAWEDQAGLYFNGAVGSALTLTPNLSFSALSKDNIFAGVRVSLHGLELDLIFDTANANPGEWPFLTCRPSELIFERGAETVG